MFLLILNKQEYINYILPSISDWTLLKDFITKIFKNSYLQNGHFKFKKRELT